MLLLCQKDILYALSMSLKKLYFIFMKGSRCLILWTSVVFADSIDHCALQQSVVKSHTTLLPFLMRIFGEFESVSRDFPQFITFWERKWIGSHRKKMSTVILLRNRSNFVICRLSIFHSDSKNMTWYFSQNR